MITGDGQATSKGDTEEAKEEEKEAVVEKVEKRKAIGKVFTLSCNSSTVLFVLEVYHLVL